MKRAVPLYEGVLADRQRVLGDDHPASLTTQSNLAVAYWSNDQRNEAITALEAAGGEPRVAEPLSRTRPPATCRSDGDPRKDERLSTGAPP